MLILSTTSDLCFAGLDLHRILTDRPPTTAISVALAVISLIFLILNTDSGDNHITVALGAASLSAVVACGFYAVTVALFHDSARSEALAVASAVILILLAPSIAIRAAGIRVPGVSAVGENFDDSGTPEISRDAPKRAGWILDDIPCSDTGGLSIFALMVLFSGAYANKWWPLSMAAAVIVFCAIHSRGQTRKVASAYTALTGPAAIVAVAFRQWFEDNWPVAAGLIVPMLAATALVAFLTSRISPTTRRIAELTEACSIAAILSIAAIIAELPEFVGGFFP